jgi:hypothetical protein
MGNKIYSSGSQPGVRKSKNFILVFDLRVRKYPKGWEPLLSSIDEKKNLLIKLSILITFSSDC